MAKRCTKCGVVKPREDFHRSKRRSDGRVSWCKTCVSDYAREWYNDPDTKARVLEKQMERYWNFSPEQKKKVMDRQNEIRRFKLSHLKSRYNLTREDYFRMLEAQGGGCWICGTPPKPEKNLQVDHDHSCCPGGGSCGACVRGLLCPPCNMRLSTLENTTWVAGATRYLEYYKSLKREKEEDD